MAQHPFPNPMLYVGTYSVRGSEGIYAFSFDPQTGTAQLQQTVSQGQSPSFLAIHPTGPFLYAVYEEDELGPDQSGSICSYAIDPATGRLTFLNQQRTHGQEPCHVALDRSGRWAFVSNYGSGSLTVFPVAADGSLGEACQTIQHVGHGVDPERQAGSHVHSAVVSVDNQLLYVSDLGTDTVQLYQLDAVQGELRSWPATPYLNVSAGSGPRMMAVHPGDEWLYGLKEMSSTVARFRRNRQTGTVDLVEDDVPFLTETYDGERSGGHIQLDAGGRYLYATNRGNNTLAIFSLNKEGGLTPCGLHYTGGDEPRHFLIDEPSQYLLIGHQESDTITIFKRDADSDDLTATGDQIAIPSPVCLLMYRGAERDE